MSIDKKILEEINRYRSINNYITEQDAAVPDLGALTPPPADVNIDAPPPPTPGGTEVEKIDVENDPDVEKIDNKGDKEDKGGDTNSDFNGDRVVLNNDDLNTLEEDIKKGNLPKTAGFFFGESDGNESVDDLVFVENAKQAIKEGYTVYYTSWW